MSKFELSLSRDYVPGWGVPEAVRELFQNALDEQTADPANVMDFEYVPEEEKLTITNKTSSLSTKSLLLGTSSKRDDESTVGQFGEGYKIATLVLLREGLDIVFYNYGKKEVWRPRFVNSRRYGTEVLTFFVDKKFPWTKVPDNNLTIEITGLTAEMFMQVRATNLHVSQRYATEPLTTLETEYGSILLDDDQKHKVYVNGLFVCEYQGYEYGYNFKPGHLALDRDRKLASDFDLKWLASTMWLDNGGDREFATRAAALAEIGAADVAYVNSIPSMREGFDRIAQEAFEMFRRRHGAKAVPVSSQHEAESLDPVHKPIYVSPGYKELVTGAAGYEEPSYIHIPTLHEEVEHWIKLHESEIPEHALASLREILARHEEGQ